MKYFSRLGIYKNSTSSNTYNPSKKIAVSYGWWTYLRPCPNKDRLIFNNYNYSNSTSKHQNDTWRLLSEYDRKDMLVLRYTPESLSDLSGAMNSELKHVLCRIRELKDLINRPRTRKSTNEKRREEIAELEVYALDLIGLMKDWNIHQTVNVLDYTPVKGSLNVLKYSSVQSDTDSASV